MSHRVTLQVNGDYWLARWKDDDGNPRAKSLGNRSKVTKGEARAACMDIERDFMLNPARKRGRGSASLAAWCTKYEEIRTDEVGAGTLALDRDTIAYLKRHFGGDRRLSDIGPAQADDWRRWMGKQPNAQGEPISPHTVASHVRRAKVLFERARKRGLIALNPFMDVSTAAPRVSKQWAEITREDLKRILEECPSAAWRNLFAVCRLAGLRLGEARRLTWADVDWGRHTLQVWTPEGIETTKHRARIVPMEPWLYQVLWESFEASATDDERPCWLGGDLYRRAKPILERAGIQPYAKLFHTLRKCLESEWMAKHPAPSVCDWLGHSAAVAAKHYVRPTADAMRGVTGQPESSAQTAHKLVQT